VSRSTLDMDWTGILVDPYLSKRGLTFFVFSNSIIDHSVM
jgi:hypothetical protein